MMRPSAADRDFYETGYLHLEPGGISLEGKIYRAKGPPGVPISFLPSLLPAWYAAC